MGKEKIIKGVRTFVAPILKYPLHFVIVALALYATEMIIWPGVILKLKIAIANLLGSFTVSILIAYLVCAGAYLLSKISEAAGRVCAFCVSLFIVFICAVECFLFFEFGAQFGISVFLLIAETTYKESFEFLTTYVFTLKGLVLILAVVALIFGLCKLSSKLRLRERLSNCLSFGIVPYLLFAYIIYSFVFFGRCVPYYFTNRYLENLGAGGPCDEVRNSLCFRTYNGLLQLSEEFKSFELCGISQENAGTYEIGRKIRNIVLVIGESHNKHHSSLYGYGMDTNPRLSAEHDLAIFSDVIAPACRTSLVFRSILSMASVNDTIKWYETPLVLSLMKNAGYNVVFYSNQFVNSPNGDQYDASCGFFFHPKVRPHIFSHFNSVQYTYDGELIESFFAQKDSLQCDSCNLYIIHLCGQHVQPSARYPKDSTVFVSNDYKYRTELNDRERREVAEYDNATRYNDFIVSEIINHFRDDESIVIYFSDHGDEANDYRPHVGRSHNFSDIGAPGMHCQLDIPFIVYMSDAFKEKYPEVSENIKSSVDKPFMTDDLPYVLLDLVDMKSKWNIREKSLFNPEYNQTRKRVIDRESVKGGWVLDYDLIVDKYGKWKIGY